MSRIIHWLRGRLNKQAPVALSLYAESAAIYEESKTPNVSVYRDVRAIPSFESTIVVHNKVLAQALYCLLERKPYKTASYEEKLIPKYKWFLSPDGNYLNVEHHWQELCRLSVEFLQAYDKEMESVDNISQLNVYRLGPIATLIVTMAREVKHQDSYFV